VTFGAVLESGEEDDIATSSPSRCCNKVTDEALAGQFEYGCVPVRPCLAWLGVAKGRRFRAPPRIGNPKFLTSEKDSLAMTIELTHYRRSCWILYNLELANVATPGAGFASSAELSD
jgi:hypothetical protein